jgi:hypothetical protein
MRMDTLLDTPRISLRLVHRRTRLRTALALASLLALVAVFYVRPGMLRGTSSLAGMDYDQMHVHRLRFARDALFGAGHTLPGWYPHEVLGSPFLANLQSFPWIPTRLVLLLIDPSIAYAAGIFMAAALSAVFTWLYCRQAGMSRLGAWTSAGTFAAAGFFASRVMAGHLPLLEAYPALPLLLWLVDRAVKRRRFDLGALAVCCAFVVSAGHPQLPAYAVGSALLYAAWRSRGWLRARIIAAMLLGCGLAMAVWWPMLLLIGRSTRILVLSSAANDVAMPYGRLLALIVPGLHGWPSPVPMAEAHPFDAWPNPAYFWDTASYIGILPLVAIVLLLVRCIVRKRMPGSRWLFLTLLGVAALLGSLPLTDSFRHLLPGTLLRSPSRLLYISTFCTAVAMGAAVDALRRSPVRNTLLGIALCIHFIDLWGFAHLFIQENPHVETPLAFQGILDRELGDGRIAVERDAALLSYEDRYDDAGGFDSIFLASFSRRMAALADMPAGHNWQRIDASELPVNALRAAGVKFVITTDNGLYRVPNPEPRANVPYTRPSSDEIRLMSSRAGVVSVLEAYDPGWSATVDGARGLVIDDGGFAMKVQVPAGKHEVRLAYKTPGRGAGAALSLLSLSLLVVLIKADRRDRPGGARPGYSPDRYIPSVHLREEADAMTRS